jgi:hypothetical protein
MGPLGAAAAAFDAAPRRRGPCTGRARLALSQTSFVAPVAEPISETVRGNQFAARRLEEGFLAQRSCFDHLLGLVAMRRYCRHGHRAFAPEL